MLFLIYKIVTFIIFITVYPYGRLRVAFGSPLWRGRLGLPSADSLTGSTSDDPMIWMHAASVGEVRILHILINYLLRDNLKLRLHVTTVTATGHDTAVKLFGKAVTVSRFPLDAPPAMRRAFDSIQPTMVVIAETEIWFNMLDEALKRDIPLILINGRMSAGAFGRYRMIRKTVARFLSQYDRLFVKSDEDAKRYAFFEISPNRLQVVGDMKFDAPLTNRSEGRRQELRSRAGVDRNDFLLVAGSTRPGEEEILFRMYRDLRDDFNHLRLIIAPRHVERVGEIKQILHRQQLAFSTYLSGDSAQPIILVDRMGLLSDLYLAADLAFVGGTLAEVGGHNLLEPVWAGTPVLFGPSLDNVKEAAEYISSNNYGSMVASVDELVLVVEKVMSGNKTFAIKTESAQAQSPTAHIGAYLLERLSHA